MDWVEELDDILATVEGTVKGSEGDMITKARGMIQEQRQKAGQYETIVNCTPSEKAIYSLEDKIARRILRRASKGEDARETARDILILFEELEIPIEKQL